MIRVSRLLVGVAFALAIQGGPAPAQYHYPYGAGYGGYGFGGWGQTPQGATAAGMGAFAAGAGTYNVNTAAARSVNANTAMQWNNYWWSAQHSLNEEHAARMKQERKDINSSADAIQQRLRDNPNDGDIDHGDAENAVLEQLTSPSAFQGSGLARANGQIPAAVVKRIPFRYAPEMAVICIDRLKNDVPALLMSDSVKAEREAFVAAVKKGMAQIKAGQDVSPQIVNEVRTAGIALNDKVQNGLPDATLVERNKATTYLRNMKAFLRMLKSPDFDQAIRELDQYKTTTVGALIAFMHTFNLRFGPATTQEETATYRTLYPLLRADRDKVLAGGPSAAPAFVPGSPPPPLPGIFQGIEDKHLDAGK
jgi:hypothetical protein